MDRCVVAVLEGRESEVESHPLYDAVLMHIARVRGAS